MRVSWYRGAGASMAAGEADSWNGRQQRRRYGGPAAVANHAGDGQVSLGFVAVPVLLFPWTASLAMGIDRN